MYTTHVILPGQVVTSVVHSLINPQMFSSRDFGGWCCGSMAKPLKGHDYRGTAKVPGRHVHIGQKRLVLFSRTWIRIFDLFIEIWWPLPSQSWPKPDWRSRDSLTCILACNGSKTCHEPDAVVIILFDYDSWLATDNLSIRTLHCEMTGPSHLSFPPDKKNAKKGRSRPFFPCGHHETRVVKRSAVFQMPSNFDLMLCTSIPVRPRPAEIKEEII